MRRTAATLAITAAALAVGACETSTWTEKCTTDSSLRSCDISVSGTKFNDLPFPLSGPVLEEAADRFRLEEATKGGTARFSAGSTEGGTYTCEAGQTVEVADSTITCTEVGDTSLKFTVKRVR